MTRQAVSLRFGIRTALALCGTMAVAACAAKYTQVPARVNLEPYRQVALVTFSAERADTGMSVLATEQFAEALLASQGVELLEIGTRDSALSALEAKGVPAVFVGHLKLSDVKPRGHVGAAGMHLRGAVRDVLRRMVIASIGPTTTQELRQLGIEVDLEPSHPKMGFLVREAAEQATELLRRKRV